MVPSGRLVFCAFEEPHNLVDGIAVDCVVVAVCTQPSDEFGLPVECDLAVA